MVEKPGRQQLCHVFKVNLSDDVMLAPCVPAGPCPSVLFLPRPTPRTRREKASDKPTLRYILQNIWPVPFESAESVKTKERLRSCHRWEETKRSQ